MVLFATLLKPNAALLELLAVFFQPTAELNRAEAVLLPPSAEELVPLAVLLKPSALLFLLLAVLLWPKAEALVLLAMLAWPTADAPLELAVLASPPAYSVWEETKHAWIKLAGWFPASSPGEQQTASFAGSPASTRAYFFLLGRVACLRERLKLLSLLQRSDSASKSSEIGEKLNAACCWTPGLSSVCACIVIRESARAPDICIQAAGPPRFLGNAA